MAECKIYKNTANMSLETWVGWNGCVLWGKKYLGFQNPDFVMGQVAHDDWRQTIFHLENAFQKQSQWL